MFNPEMNQQEKEWKEKCIASFKEESPELKDGDIFLTHYSDIRDPLNEYWVAAYKIDRDGKMIASNMVSFPNLPKKMPKLSWVMPTRNRLEWLGESLQSLLTQTIVKETEIIVVNDASNDGTKEFLDEWTPQFKEVKVIHNETQMGGGKSRNIGMEAAQAPLIGVCDDDDLNSDQRGELILEHFKLNPKSELVTFPYRAIGYYNEKLEDFEGAPFDHEAFLERGAITFFSNPSAAYKKEAALAVGGYGSEFTGEHLKETDDVQFLRKWVKSGRKVDFQPGYMVCFHRILADSMMSKIRGWKPEWATKQ